VTLGLLLNEAVSNSFKHAFEPGTSGDITVRLEQLPDGLHVTVQDTGCGFPEGFEPDQTRTLGLSLMASLVQQIGGELEVSNAPGARLHFRLSPRATGESP